MVHIYTQYNVLVNQASLIVTLFQLHSSGIQSIRWCDFKRSNASALSLLFNDIIDELPGCFLNLFLRSSFLCISESQDVSCWGCNANSTIPSAFFVAAVALQKKFPLFRKFSRNHGSMPKTYIHVLSIWGKHIYGQVPPKKLWGCCGSAVLTGASCWPSSNCILVQKIGSLSTELNHSRSTLCWTPTMVCAVTTPLHSLCQGSPHYGPLAKSDLWSYFTRHQNKFCK